MELRFISVLCHEFLLTPDSLNFTRIFIHEFLISRKWRKVKSRSRLIKGNRSHDPSLVLTFISVKVSNKKASFDNQILVPFHMILTLPLSTEATQCLGQKGQDWNPKCYSFGDKLGQWYYQNFYRVLQ